MLVPAISLTSSDSLRDRLNRTPTLTAYLTELEDRGVLGIYSDPIGNILAVNQLMSDIFTGIEEFGNVMKWWFSPAALQVVPQWDVESDFLVGTFKAAFGRHRTAPAANELLRHLRRYHAFTQRWLNSTFVAYNRPTARPIRLRLPPDGVLTATVHRSDVIDSRQIVLHTMYPRSATARSRAARTTSHAMSSDRQYGSISNYCAGGPM